MDDLSSTTNDFDPLKVESEKVLSDMIGDIKPKEASGLKATEVVEGGVVLCKDKESTECIHAIDPDEVFAHSDPDGGSTDSTFTWSRPGYRGYKHCYLNDAGDYVRYVQADGTEVLYNGSLDTDSEWNKQWCKRVKREVISSDDSDEVSSRHPAKKPKQ